MEDLSGIPLKKLKTESDDFESASHDDGRVTTVGDSEDDSKSEGLEQSDLPNQVSNGIPDQLLQIESKYNQLFSYLTFEEPIANVYNPLLYAHKLHSQFVHKFCQTKKEILFLGMNPGPWGMSQTGVPFGEVSAVRDWMGITGEVEKPEQENPHRPVTGLLCERSEVSGKKFWGAIKKIFGKNPYDFWKNCHVHNYCPLAFLAENGKNITPAELGAHEKGELFRICDDLLMEVLFLLNVKTIVAIGKFAETQAKIVIKEARLDSIKFLSIPHPSSRNAGVSKTWEAVTIQTLKELVPQ